MSKKLKRDERWLAVYGAVFARLLVDSEQEERPSRKRSLQDCVRGAENRADEELSLRAEAVPNPAKEQRARRKKVAK